MRVTWNGTIVTAVHADELSSTEASTAGGLSHVMITSTDAGGGGGVAGGVDGKGEDGKSGCRGGAEGDAGRLEAFVILAVDGKVLLAASEALVAYEISARLEAGEPVAL